QQAQQGAEEGDLQRAGIGRPVEAVLAEEDVVAEVDQHLQLLVGVGEDVRVGRNRHVGLGEADLQHDGERQQEEQHQPQKGYADDQSAPGVQPHPTHACSTTPLSLSQWTYTCSSQVGHFTWRSALATKACSIRPDSSLM